MPDDRRRISGIGWVSALSVSAGVTSFAPEEDVSQDSVGGRTAGLRAGDGLLGGSSRTGDVAGF